VVNVASRPRDSAVVKYLDVWHLAKSFGQLLLSNRATLPRARRLRVVRNCQHNTAQDVSQPTFDSSLSSEMSALVLVVCRAAGYAGVIDLVNNCCTRKFTNDALDRPRGGV